MSGCIWLIVEDKNDADVVRTILSKKSYVVRVETITPTGGSGGISRLANQLKNLMATIRANPHFNEKTDCIAVLHDHDMQRQRDRSLYDRITEMCRTHGVKSISAVDELEAWILADTGICGWLNESPRNWDEQREPSERLNSFMKEKHGIKYQGRYREQVLAHMKGDGDQHSPSMRSALQFLIDAPCVSTQT